MVILDMFLVWEPLAASVCSLGIVVLGAGLRQHANKARDSPMFNTSVV